MKFEFWSKCQKFENKRPACQMHAEPCFIHSRDLVIKEIVRKIQFLSRKSKLKRSEKKLFNTNSFFWSYHGSNSWMMLSNRITAKSRLAKPTSHAKERMVKVSKDCQPIVCVFASAEVIFPSFDPDASLLRSTSILEAGPRFYG